MYVDESDSTLVLKRRRMVDDPAQWVTVDRIDLTDPALVHPVVETDQYSDSLELTVVIYEDILSLRYSIYSGLSLLVGTWVTNQSTINDVTFRDLILADGYAPGWRNRTYQPELPSIAGETPGANTGNWSIVWKEGNYPALRNQRLVARPDQQSNIVSVHDYDPQLIPANGFPPVAGTGPSLAFHGSGFLNYAAYEFLNSGVFPNPSNVGASGISLLGRTFMPVTSYYPQAPGGGTPSLPPCAWKPCCGSTGIMLRYVLQYLVPRSACAESPWLGDEPS